MGALLNPQNWANGLLLGALYAVAAVGFAMVWGVLNVIDTWHKAQSSSAGHTAPTPCSPTLVSTPTFRSPLQRSRRSFLASCCRST